MVDPALCRKTDAEEQPVFFRGSADQPEKMSASAGHADTLDDDGQR